MTPKEWFALHLPLTAIIIVKSVLPFFFFLNHQPHNATASAAAAAAKLRQSCPTL